jgi:hypothetical protein
MRDMIEMAIEREAELLDAVLEFPETVEVPAFAWRNSRGRLSPETRKFSARGTSRRRPLAHAAARPSYLN